MELVKQIVFAMILFTLVFGIPAFAENNDLEHGLTEQQKKQIENMLHQTENEPEFEGDDQLEQEVDRNGLSFLGMGTTGLIFYSTVASILAVTGYAGYKVLSIKRAMMRKKRAGLEGLPK